jgi:hypothetical protein
MVLVGEWCFECRRITQWLGRHIESETGLFSSTRIIYKCQCCGTERSRSMIFSESIKKKEIGSKPKTKRVGMRSNRKAKLAS